MSRKPPPTRRYVSYLDLKLRNDPRYIERLLPAVLNWDEVRKREENKERRNEEIFKRAFYKVKQRGSFNTNEFVSAFRHAEVRGNINENNFVKHFLRRKTKKVKSRKNRVNSEKTRKRNSPKVVHSQKEVNLNAPNANEQMARKLQENYTRNPNFLNRTKILKYKQHILVKISK